eukprot:UN07534
MHLFCAPDGYILPKTNDDAYNRDKDFMDIPVIVGANSRDGLMAPPFNLYNPIMPKTVAETFADLARFT